MGITLFKRYQEAIINGVLASLGLLGLYFFIMRLATGSWEVAVDQFVGLWILMGLLIIGFGIQIGLYSALKDIHHLAAKGQVAASGATSTVAMIACCAHHVTDVLPLVGLAGVSLFLAEYQSLFLGIGVLSNVLGIVYLIRKYQQLKLIKGVAFREVVAQVS
mgnify:CR=1 FL=1